MFDFGGWCVFFFFGGGGFFFWAVMFSLPADNCKENLSTRAHSHPWHGDGVQHRIAAEAEPKGR